MDAVFPPPLTNNNGLQAVVSTLAGLHRSRFVPVRMIVGTSYVYDLYDCQLTEVKIQAESASGKNQLECIHENGA